MTAPTPKYKVAVIGAGITGLSAAVELMREGAKVTILEKSPRTGGIIQTFQEDGFTVEAGPQTMQLRSAAVERFFREHRLDEHTMYPSPIVKNRFVLKNKQLVPVPMTPWQMLRTPLLSAKGKLRLLREPWAPMNIDDTEETLSHFTKRRLGEEVLDYAIDPFVSGVYAGVPERLSLRYAFPKLHFMEAQYGSLIKAGLAKRRKAKNKGVSYQRYFSFAGGMETLTRLLTEKVTPDLYTGANITRIEKRDGWVIHWGAPAGHGHSELYEDRFDAILVTIPAHKLSSLPWPSHMISEFGLFNQIEYPPITAITLGFEKKQIKHPLNGFGFLVPRKEKRQILGTVFTTTRFPELAPPGHESLHTFIGGARQPELTKLTASEKTALVMGELTDILNIQGEPVFCKQIDWPLSIPQYNVGYGQYHERWINIEAAHDGIYFAGMARGGAAVAQCIESGIASAQRICKEKPNFHKPLASREMATV